MASHIEGAVAIDAGRKLDTWVDEIHQVIDGIQSNLHTLEAKIAAVLAEERDGEEAPGRAQPEAVPSSTLAAKLRELRSHAHSINMQVKRLTERVDL